LKILEQAVIKFKDGEEFVLATVVNTSGSVPAEVGFRMIVSARSTDGTVGGGSLEKRIIEKARGILEKKAMGCLVKVTVGELGMHCGGEASVYLEPFYSKPDLWIFGGGHIAYELAPLASSAGFRVTVVDNRVEYADKNRFPAAGQVLKKDYSKAARAIPSGSYVVIVTHEHAHDEEILLEAARLSPPLPYIGMIGSKKKVKHTLERLKSNDIEIGNNIYSPIGLDIGGGSPAEIAVSIVSELLGVLHKKKGLPHCRKHL
jgi:xanthine dehydrogenase accessory factor